MKRLFSIILALVTVLCGCQSSPMANETAPVQQILLQQLDDSGSQAFCVTSEEYRFWFESYESTDFPKQIDAVFSTEEARKAAIQLWKETIFEDINLLEDYWESSRIEVYFDQGNLCWMVTATPIDAEEGSALFSVLYAVFQADGKILGIWVN